MMLEFPDFLLFNLYVPNGNQGPQRVKFKMEFNETILDCFRDLLQRGKHIIACGDFNTAHREIDLARPKATRKRSGFLPLECEWIDRLLDEGFTDSFRYFNQDPGNYTWWDQVTRARERNVGWRLDYCFVSSGMLPHVKSGWIATYVTGSDHCPVGIEIEF